MFFIPIECLNLVSHGAIQFNVGAGSSASGCRGPKSQDPRET